MPRSVLGVLLVACLMAGCGKGEEGEHNHAHHGHDHHGHDHGHDDSAHHAHMEAVRKDLRKALGVRYDEAVPDATAEQLERGKTIYGQTCATCHGLSGKGDGPAAKALKQKPADFTDASHARFYSDQARLHIIRKGVPGTPMVGWEQALGGEGVMAVHAYVRSLRGD